MSDIALIASPDSYEGGVQAGVEVRSVSDPVRLEGEIERLAEKGCVVIMVTADLVSGSGRQIIDRAAAAFPELSLIVVPGPGTGEGDFVKALRERFSAALGIDIWRVSSEKAGVDL